MIMQFYVLSVEYAYSGGYYSAEVSVTAVHAIQNCGAAEASVARPSGFPHSFSRASSVLHDRCERLEVSISSISSLDNSGRHYSDAGRMPRTHQLGARDPCLRAKGGITR